MHIVLCNIYNISYIYTHISYCNIYSLYEVTYIHYIYDDIYTSAA